MDVGWQAGIFPYLSPDLVTVLGGLSPRRAAGAREIRMRKGLPLCVVGTGGPLLVPAPDGQTTVRCHHIEHTIERMCEGSVYSRQREFEQGFLTLPGGHRVGMVGRTILGDGPARLTPETVTSLNIRIAREMRGAAGPLLERLGGPGRPLSTLIFSPPGAGKTTMLRDLVRLLAHHLQVGVVDERGELAGSDGRGRHLDLGPMSDVLEYCPKAQAAMWFIRAMGPQVLAMDEIGGAEDAAAVLDASRAGIVVLATAHAGTPAELIHRDAVRGLITGGAFARLVQLGFSRGPGTIEAILSSEEVLAA